MALVVAAGFTFFGYLSFAVNTVATNVVQTIAISKKKKPFSWCTDDDDRRRVCTVRWYTRRIFMLCYHWAFTFDWGDYKVTYEADEVDGYLIPRWKIGGPDLGPPGHGAPYQWNEEKTFQLICSPKEVNDHAFRVPFNGVKYILTKMNCHLFIKCLALALGINDVALNSLEKLLIPAPIVMAADWLNKVGASSKSA